MTTPELLSACYYSFLFSFIGPCFFVVSASSLIALLPAVVSFLMCTQTPWICPWDTFVAIDTKWYMYHPQLVCTVPLRTGAAVHVLILIFCIIAFFHRDAFCVQY